MTTLSLQKPNLKGIGRKIAYCVRGHVRKCEEGRKEYLWQRQHEYRKKEGACGSQWVEII
jgi:hypothetical protein